MNCRIPLPFLLILFIFGSNFVFSQKNISEISETSQKTAIIPQNSTIGSNIISSGTSDTLFFKVELKNGAYEPSKKNFPYYGIAKTTGYTQSATPTLIIKKTIPVAEPHASVIRKFYGQYLTTNFEIVPQASLSRNTNLNHNQLFPFRINASQQIEELVDYEVTWQVSGNSNKSVSTGSFTNNSVLASGNWFKMGVTQTGIHKINKAFLTSIGLDITKINPARIRVYGNGGKMLPELNSAPRHDDLIENAIFVSGEDDGVFNDNDFALFYATGPTEWKKTNQANGLKFSPTKNLYSDSSFYFITIDPNTNGKRIQNIVSVNAPSNKATSSYDYYNFHEEDLYNFIKSGRDFYGEYFDINNTYTFNWNDGDFLSDSIFAEATIMSRAREQAKYLINGSGLNFQLTTASVNVDYYLGEYGDARTVVGAAKLPANSPNINITITKQTANAVGWLDKLTINARRTINLTTKQFQFRDTRTAGAGNICEFQITAPATATPTIWNVSDPLNPLVQEYTSTGASITFKSNTDSLNEFCISPSTDFHIPISFGKVANKNLHALTQADYVIITHPLFTAQAQRLANLHQIQEGLTYAIATTEQIYNEFSSGRPDISAIRDFIRMLYTRGMAVGKPVKYVILLGDGSYKNKSRNLLNNSNLIPTYQSQNSLDPLSSMATDDFYGLMDPNEGYLAENIGKMDLGTGRLTCRNAGEMNAVVGKIENYYKKDGAFRMDEITPENCNNLSESNMGEWRTWLMFVADDGDAAEHMWQSDSLTRVVKSKSQLFNYDKIFLDAYQIVSTPGGKRYPDAAEDFNRRLKKGVLLFNYTGHGGEVGLTEERILDVPTINNFDNVNKLPLFVTATCEFSRYDDPERTSAGELCLLNSKGGAVALLTTCRVAFSNYNMNLNQVVLKNLFSKVGGKWPTLGDVAMKTKAELSQSLYYANFHLLGDPALPLAYPEQQITTSKINNVTITPLSRDTMAALAKMTVSGYMADNSGNKLSNYNGIVYSNVFDKEKVVTCLLNNPNSLSRYVFPRAPFQFPTQKNILYRGKSQIINGDFSFTFIVPKDISFAPGQGRISYYATNGQTDAAGSYSNIIVGGSSKNVIVDNDGPQVSLFLNDKNFLNGGTTNEKPVLYADLVDSSGINTVGNGIGHDISVVLDATGNNPVVLNDYYEANLNSYQSGRVRYPFNELSEGEHRLTFKVWDIQNNSNIAYSDFIVASSAELALKHVLNYPNPFTTRTKFFFEHNQACNPLKVTIQIFTISGKAVKTIQQSITCEGFRPEGIDWDGKDDYGDKLARGVYIYKLAIIDIDNKKAEKIEKLVILN